MKSVAFAITLFVLLTGCAPAEKVQTYEDVVMLLEAESKELDRLKADVKESEDYIVKCKTVETAKLSKFREEFNQASSSQLRRWIENPPRNPQQQQQFEAFKARSMEEEKSFNNTISENARIIDSNIALTNEELIPQREKVANQQAIVDELRERKNKLRK